MLIKAQVNQEAVFGNGKRVHLMGIIYLSTQI